MHRVRKKKFTFVAPKKTEVTKFEPGGTYDSSLNIDNVHEWCLSQITEKERKDRFILKTKKPLDEWREIRDQPIAFGGNSENEANRLRAVQKYIEASSRFINLGLRKKEVPKNTHCPNCGQEYTVESEYFICTTCRSYEQRFTSHVSYGDKERINTSNQNTYDNSESFLPALQRYQGIENVEFPKEMNNKIREWCYENDIDPADLRPQTALIAFQKCKYNDYYKNVLSFLNRFNGYPLPNIREHVPKIIADYQLFRAEYDKVKKPSESSLNAQYMIYILLRRHNIPLKEEDLKIPKTVDIRKKNDSIAVPIFRKLGWDFEPTV